MLCLNSMWMSASNEASVITQLVVNTILYFLPALVANGAPVAFVGHVIKRRTRLDLGKNFIDGKPLLGPNKTVEGLLVGCVSGALVGVAYSIICHNPAFIVYGLVMGLGAMIGDALNSFIKRRLGISSGEPFVPLDQLSFLLIAYLVVRVFWLDRICGIDLNATYLAMAVVIVMILHPLSNLISYLIGLKDKPW